MGLSPMSLYFLCCTTLAWHHWCNKAVLPMFPLSVHNTSSGTRKLRVLQGLAQGFGYPSSPLPSAASWDGTPPQWQRDTQMYWRAGSCWVVQTTWGFPALWSSRWSSFPFLRLALGFLKLALHTVFFWSWLLSQACLKFVSELWGVIGTFTDLLTGRAFFRERVKNLVLHRFRSLVTVILKHLNISSPEQGC